MINNDRIIRYNANFIRILFHHGWKAGKLYYDVKKEIQLNKIVAFLFISNESPRKGISEKKVKIDPEVNEIVSCGKNGKICFVLYTKLTFVRVTLNRRST